MRCVFEILLDSSEFLLFKGWKYVKNILASHYNYAFHRSETYEINFVGTLLGYIKTYKNVETL